MKPGKYKITQSTGNILIVKEYIVNEKLTFEACIGVVSEDWQKSNSCFSETGMYVKFSKKPKMVDEVKYMTTNSARYIMIEKLK